MKKVIKLEQRWSPYRTIDSLCLRKILNRGINIEYKNFLELRSM